MARVINMDMSSNSNNNTINVQQHNANISSQIAALKSKIESYKSVQSDASSIASELESLSNDAKAAGDSLENIVISGKPIDNNGVFKSTSNNLINMASAFTNIVNVCSQKISEIEEQINNLNNQYI